MRKSKEPKIIVHNISVSKKTKENISDWHLSWIKKYLNNCELTIDQKCVILDQIALKLEQKLQ